MRRSPRVLLAWAAAVIVTLLTIRVVGDDLGSLHRRAHDLGADISVVLAARDLPLGLTVTAADLRVVKRPSSTVASDALRDPSRAVGQTVALALLRDDLVRARHLATAEGGIVADGRRAVHVVAKDGFQPPVGAVVDVLATYDPSIARVATSPGMATVVAHGARVIVSSAADRARAADGSSDNADSSGSGVTLVVTESEARSVAYAASIGELSLAIAPVRSACCSPVAP